MFRGRGASTAAVIQHKFNLPEKNEHIWKKLPEMAWIFLFWISNRKSSWKKKKIIIIKKL